MDVPLVFSEHGIDCQKKKKIAKAAGKVGDLTFSLALSDKRFPVFDPLLTATITSAWYI